VPPEEALFGRGVCIGNTQGQVAVALFIERAFKFCCWSRSRDMTRPGRPYGAGRWLPGERRDVAFVVKFLDFGNGRRGMKGSCWA
jgi:hypothetical protein